MSITHDTPTLPDGVRFYHLSGTAETWEAYDALTEEDGWIERTGDENTWKNRDLESSGYVTVHEPHEARS